MDDDDFLLPNHFQQISFLAHSILQKSSHQVTAVGLYRQRLASLTDDGAVMTTVDFSRCIPGNKFYVIPADYFSSAADYSPWGIPELIDEEAVDRFFKQNIHLTLVRNNEPTFIYMRRGSNLSRNDKSDYIDHSYDNKRFANEQDLLNHSSAATSIEMPTPDMRPLPRQFHMTASRSGSGKTTVTTNFLKLFHADSTIAFYLMQGTNRIDTIWYSRNESVVFTNVPRGCSVRAFVRMNGEIIHRKLVRIWD